MSNALAMLLKLEILLTVPDFMDDLNYTVVEEAFNDLRNNCSEIPEDTLDIIHFCLYTYLGDESIDNLQ